MDLLGGHPPMQGGVMMDWLGMWSRCRQGDGGDGEVIFGWQGVIDVDVFSPAALKECESQG